MNTAETTLTSSIKSENSTQKFAPSKGSFWERMDGRLNPFFVKDVRAWLRSKKFLTLFFTALAGCQIVTVMIIVDGETGRNLFSVLVGGLAMVLVGVVPYLMQDRFADELSSGSTQLAMLSRMTPGNMVRGKIQSGLLANLLFFSAVGPSVLIAYMLGGVHPYVMLYVLLAVLVLSTLSMVLAMVVVTIMGRKPVKVISLVLFGVGFGAATAMFGLSQSGAADEMFVSDDFWYINLMIAAETLFGGLFLYSISVSRLSFSSANRDFWPRLMLSVWTLLHLFIGFGAVFFGSYFVPIGDHDDICEIAIIFATLVFTFGIFLLANTSDTLSRRILQKRSNPVVNWFLLPGRGRLYFFVMFHFAVFTLFSLLYYFNISHGRDGISYVGFVFAAYYLISISYLSYRFVQRVIFKNKPIPPTMTMAIAAAIWLGWGTLLAAIFESDLGFGHIVSPASTFYFIAKERSSTDFVEAVLATSPVWLTASIFWLNDLSKALKQTSKDVLRMKGTQEQSS